MIGASLEAARGILVAVNKEQRLELHLRHGCWVFGGGAYVGCGKEPGTAGE